MVNIIVAMDKNRLIGNRDKIPWHLTRDLQFFKKMTIGQVVIMGNKSFEYMMAYYQKSGRPIPQRVHIVMSRDKEYKVEQKDCYVANSLDEALKICSRYKQKEVYVAGGSEIFKLFLPITDRMYITEVEGDFIGDKYFPEFDLETWKLESEEKWEKDEKNKFDAKLLIYKKNDARSRN